MVSVLLLVRITETGEAPAAGPGKPASGSATEAAPVWGAGLKVAVLDTLTPPTTLICEAVMLALPLATIAEDDLESTSTGPRTLMLEVPAMVRAPLAVAFST